MWRGIKQMASEELKNCQELTLVGFTLETLPNEFHFKQFKQLGKKFLIYISSLKLYLSLPLE